MKLDMRLSQRPLMSQNMQQSIFLLSLSNEELEEEIQTEVLKNPLLEIEDKRELDFLKPQPFSLYDSLEASTTNFKNLNQSPFNSQHDFVEQPETLKSFLLKQTQQSFVSRDIKRILEVLISYLDEKAYLRVDLRSLVESNQFSFERVLKALQALQSFEPYGVGARSLEECLLIQIRQKNIKNNKLEELVKHHLLFMRDKKYPYIAGELGVTLQEVRELCAVIEKLQPNPAVNFSSEPTVFVRPDIFIYKQGESFCVIFNNDTLPNVKFSKEYLFQIRRKGALKKKEKEYLNEKSSAARFFIYSLTHRQEQIKKIAFHVVKNQEEFFRKGFAFLRPLKMSDLAQEAGVHTSTVSRAVSNKYAHTPHGLMSLKSFFLRGVAKGSEENISTQKIKENVKQWIKKENPNKPLSDQDLQKRIEESFQVSISRRRVAQYRAELHIPQKRLRMLKFLFAK